MSDAKTPDRIQPIYDSPKPGGEIVLLEEEATLTQNGKEVQGKIKVSQEWPPRGLNWEFTQGNMNDFTFGQVEIQSDKFTANGTVFSKGKHRVAGCIVGEVVVGSDHKIDRVTFHLPDYFDLYGGKDYDDKIEIGKKINSKRWWEVVLEADGWRIRLQAYRDISTLRNTNDEAVLCGVGEIRKADGSQFRKKDVPPLLEALRIFLSFSFAEWSPPLLAVGSNAVAKKSCQFWGSYNVEPNRFLRGWLCELRGHYLSDAFPGFMERWKNENWQEPLLLTAHWLIETTRRSVGTEGSIIIGQIPLEMLASLVFVDDKKVLDDSEFKKISAAGKMQLLLDRCGIPLEVPPSLTSLAKLAKDTNFKNGPQLVTKVRNTIIHPNEANRKVLEDWERDHNVTIGEVRSETLELLRWYITLVLLNQIGYSGEYANRLATRNIGKYELVPWAVTDKQDEK